MPSHLNYFSFINLNLKYIFFNVVYSKTDLSFLAIIAEQTVDTWVRISYWQTLVTIGVKRLCFHRNFFF
jgi:hypothetical protein